jgi:hypothetical protein
VVARRRTHLRCIILILDLAGNHRLSKLRRVLAPRGIYISSTDAGGTVLGPLPRVLAVAVTSPFVALSETADAMRHLEAEHARGKIVLTM